MLYGILLFLPTLKLTLTLDAWRPRECHDNFSQIKSLSYLYHSSYIYCCAFCFVQGWNRFFLCLIEQVQARCYQLLLSVFQHSDRALSTPYIHALAPAVVEKLKAAESSRPDTPAELQALQEGVKVLEGLVALGEEQNSE